MARVSVRGAGRFPGFSENLPSADTSFHAELLPESPSTARNLAQFVCRVVQSRAHMKREGRTCTFIKSRKHGKNTEGIGYRVETVTRLRLFTRSARLKSTAPSGTASSATASSCMSVSSISASRVLEFRERLDTPRFRFPDFGVDTSIGVDAPGLSLDEAERRSGVSPGVEGVEGIDGEARP